MKRERLIELRQDVGQSQEEFGKIFGISGQNQSQIENGKRKPNANYILTLLDKFELTPNEVLEMFRK